MNSHRRIALVTGAGSGIGRAAALALSRAGYAVALVGRRVPPLEETAALAGGSTLVLQADAVTIDVAVADLAATHADGLARLLH